MKIAIAYYSHDGNTKFLADAMAEKLGADVIALSPLKPYPEKGFAKFFFGGKSAVFSEAPELKKYEFNGEAYDTVILGTPLWAWRISPPLRTFIAENDLKNNNIAAFISCGGGDTAKAFGMIREMTGKDTLICEGVFVNPLADRESATCNLDRFCTQITEMTDKN